MKNTCKGCDKRHAMCHSTCEEYLKFREESLKRYEKNLRLRIAKDYTKDVIDKNDHRLNRKKI